MTGRSSHQSLPKSLFCNTGGLHTILLARCVFLLCWKSLAHFFSEGFRHNFLRLVQLVGWKPLFSFFSLQVAQHIVMRL